MKVKGLLEMLGATSIWGSVPLMGIWSGLPSGVFVFFRVLFAFPFVFYFAVKKDSLKSFFSLKPFWPLLLSGVMLGVNWIFFFWAVKVTDVATVVTIYYAGPVIAILLAALFLKEKMNVFTVLSIFLAFAGVAVSSGGFNIDKGALIALLAAVSYGLLGFFSKVSTIHHKAVTVTAWQVLISIFITLPFLFLADWHFTVNGFLVTLFAGVVHTALALFLWYDSLNYIKVSFASILQYLDIVFAVILAYIFLSQVPTERQILGAVLIVSAGVLISLKEVNVEVRKRKTA
ncbi:DMT family transporter [Desulfurobacterium sp.]